MPLTKPTLKLYTQKDIKSITRIRNQETKLGEKVETIIDFPEGLTKSKSKFVLLGLPEDIGVRANYGRGGAHTAWKPALENILNIQSNQFFTGESLLVLGHIDFDQLMHQSLHLNNKSEKDVQQLRKMVELIDEVVFEVTKEIIAAGKIPIIIGGGHNNSYPLIKAASTNHVTKQINVLNCDPHTDFRPNEGRHSGNGFSCAFEEGYLNKYAVFGIHESYNTHDVLKRFQELSGQLQYVTFEDLFIAQSTSSENALEELVQFCNSESCGLEIDLDAITNVPTSAKTSSGISPVQARQFVYYATKQLQPIYFHIAEGAPILAHIKADNKTGKLIAYLVADFIKAFDAKISERKN
jgi:formiminoglutamase